MPNLKEQEGKPHDIQASSQEVQKCLGELGTLLDTLPGWDNIELAEPKAKRLALEEVKELQWQLMLAKEAVQKLSLALHQDCYC